MGDDTGILGPIAGAIFWSAVAIAIPVIIWRLAR